MSEQKTTFHGVHRWTASLYKKLGWMFLARRHKENEKIKLYKDSIKDCKIAIELKLKNTSNVDRKNDLIVLLHQIKVLQDASRKL